MTAPKQPSAPDLAALREIAIEVEELERDFTRRMTILKRKIQLHCGAKPKEKAVLEIKTKQGRRITVEPKPLWDDEDR